MLATHQRLTEDIRLESGITPGLLSCLSRVVLLGACRALRLQFGELAMDLAHEVVKMHAALAHERFPMHAAVGDLIVIVVLGGIGTLLGPLWGAIAFFALEELLQPVLNLVHTGWGEYWQIVFGPLLVLVALYARGGIDSLLGRHPGERR